MPGARRRRGSLADAPSGPIRGRHTTTRRRDMSQAQNQPSDNELQSFIGRLGEYRTSLSEGDQKLLDAMVGAALGKAPQEDEVKPFWYAYNPPGYGPYNPPGAGYAVGGGGYGGYAAGFQATPWGGAYGVRYW